MKQHWQQQKKGNRFAEEEGSLFTTAEEGRGEATGVCRGLLWPGPARGPRPASPTQTAEERKPVATAAFASSRLSLRQKYQKPKTKKN